ncbi:MAG: PPA1309 family protein [Geodermatophilaceae bacterium]
MSAPEPLPPQPLTPLETALAEVEKHADTAGWDRPPQLFALVETAELLAREPALAARVGLAADEVPPGLYTPVEQDALPEQPLDEALGHIMWPDGVVGCALVHEVLVLPPQAEEDRPDEADPTEYARTHPDRREVRLSVAVLADGTSASAVRVRSKDGAADDLMFGDDLAPNLTVALLMTLR